MPLFQKSVINKYLQQLDPTELKNAYNKFLKFYGDKDRIENIRLLKEENYQEGFLREIFVEVLGYTINPDKNYNLTTEFKNETDSKKTDGAILENGKAVGVIELKSTKTPDLESIKEQAFSYKNNQSNCLYVITSNFEKLRFYIDNATEWEEFNLFELDFERFKIFYLFLCKPNVISGVTVRLKKESLLHEENVTDNLYNDYSKFKKDIFDNLVKNNHEKNKLQLFHKSQKLLDRILFVLFAEDSGLVPPNAISKIIKQWKDLEKLDEPVTLYSRFAKLFRHLDEGHKYQTWEIPAYNGGLFRKDELLDNLIIDDEILEKQSLKLSNYDFNTEVNVNILGHIFEHSISEIEQVTAEIEGTEAVKEKSRRKKEGIFYTPKYITKYIVENTVGALCNEKKKELKIDFIENEIIENSRTAKGKLTQKAKELIGRLDEYRKYILSLKILDPACGSGAFLNQALEFLINEHQMLDGYQKEIFQESILIPDISKSILENNLYGVDINEEAVEIAKLSLWLRTAEKGRKLSNLNTNIKCGNSLIDDPEIAGEKAFDWEKEFSEIMNAGGFDVVIGNPPYVNFANLNNTERTFYKKHYHTYKNKTDLYAFFIERSSTLINNNGILSFIVPHTWLGTTSFQPLRELLIKDLNLIQIVDLNFGVFKDAIVKPLIFVSRKCKINVISVYNSFFKKKVDLIIEKIKIDPELKINLDWNPKKDTVFQKIFTNSIRLDKVIKFTRGIKTSNDKRFIKNSKDNNYCKKVIRGRNIKAYKIDYDGEYIWYKPDLMKEKVGSLPHNAELFEVKEKIIAQRINSSGELLLAYDNMQYYSLDTTNVSYFSNKKSQEQYSLKFILAVLNSKLINWWFNETFKMPTISGYELHQIPFKKVDYEKQKTFLSFVDKIINLNKINQDKINLFLSRITTNFPVDRLSNKLKEFYNYVFKTFLSELKKKKVTLSLKQQEEWEEYFSEYKKEINSLQETITQTDREIDKMVYELYGLTDDEIKIVEESVG